jgi:hypothetical protein
MKLTGPACTETMSEAEEAERRERAEDNAGGVRVERKVRPLSVFEQLRFFEERNFRTPSAFQPSLPASSSK